MRQELTSVLSFSGSISYLNATELHVLVTSTNQNLCVRYSFKGELPMRSPSKEKVSRGPFGQKWFLFFLWAVSVLRTAKCPECFAFWTLCASCILEECSESLELKKIPLCAETHPMSFAVFSNCSIR